MTSDPFSTATSYHPKYNDLREAKGKMVPNLNPAVHRRNDSPSLFFLFFSLFCFSFSSSLQSCLCSISATLCSWFLQPSQDLTWEVGNVQGLKSISLNDTKVMAMELMQIMKDNVNRSRKGSFGGKKVFF